MSTEPLTPALLPGVADRQGTHSGHSCWEVINDQPPLRCGLQLLGRQWLPDPDHHFKPPPSGPATIQNLDRNKKGCCG